MNPPPGPFSTQSLLRVPHGQHICFLFGEDDERFRVLARFFGGVLQDNQKALYVTDTLSGDELHQRFQEAGLVLSPHTTIRTTAEAYYPEGRFEPKEMCESLARFSEAALQEGFEGVRCAGEMTWALRELPGTERLLEYELMLTEYIERLPFSGICQYDVRRFDGPTLLKVLEVHPFMIVRGQILSNPHHVRRARAEIPPFHRQAL